MNLFFAQRRLFFFALIAASTMGWVACSSSETREAYDKFYGKGRAEREAEAVVADSVRRIELKAEREALAAAAPEVEAETPEESAAKEPVSMIPPADVAELLQKNTCSVCHTPDQRLVGPAWVEIAKKNYSLEEMVALVHQPKPEHWPDYPPMAPLPFVTAEDIHKMGAWINSLK